MLAERRDPHEAIHFTMGQLHAVAVTAPRVDELAAQGEEVVTVEVTRLSLHALSRVGPLRRSRTGPALYGVLL